MQDREVNKIKLRPSWSQRLLSRIDGAFSVTSKYLLVRRTRVVFDMLIYLFGREGTILISSIAFSFFVSVFPIIVLLLSAADLLGLDDLREFIFDSLLGFFPISQDFIIRNLRIYSRGLGPPQFVSLLLIAWAGRVFFFALEAGLDSAYRVSKVRNFVTSQFIGTAMTVFAAILVFAAIWILDTIELLASRIFWIAGPMETIVNFSVSFILTVSLFLALYYYLPNQKQRFGILVRVSVFASILWMITNSVFREYSSSWTFENIYGPFFVSMTLLLWAYASGCIFLGCARLARDEFFGRWQSDPFRPVIVLPPSMTGRK